MTVHLGYGRTRAGRVGNGRGLRRVRSPHRATPPGPAPGSSWPKTGQTQTLACTQDHWSIDQNAEPRHLVRSATVEEYAKDPEAIKEHGARTRRGT